MKAQDLISTLRIGSSIENPTPYKWFGLACSVGGLVIVFLSGLAAARGWIDGAVSLDNAVLIVSLVLGPLFTVSAHSAIVTTDKIGLPAKPVDPTNPVVAELRRLDNLSSDADEPCRAPSSPRGIDDVFGKFGSE